MPTIILDARGPRRTAALPATTFLAADAVVVLAGDMPPGRPARVGMATPPAADPLDATLLRAGRSGLDVYYTPPREETRLDRQRRHNFELLPRALEEGDIEPAAPAPPLVEPADVAALTTRDQLFFCRPLACRLSAGSCIDRQALAQSPREGISKPAYEARRQANDYVACGNCALGRAVATRLAP